MLTELFEIELIIYIKMDSALNNLHRLMCHKTKPKPSKIMVYFLNHAEENMD